MKVEVQLSKLQEEDQSRKEIQKLFKKTKTIQGIFHAWVTRSNVPCGIVEIEGGFFVVVAWYGMYKIE